MTPVINLMIEGRQVSGLIRAVIHSTNCYDADSFFLTLALGLPPLTNVSFWASIDAATIEITAVEGISTELLLVGVIDMVQLDPLRGTVTIEGRDLSARLIDSYWQQDFVNQTASEVVTTIALQCGLMPIVSNTTGIVGRYYNDGYTRLSLGQFSKFRSNWDVVVQLARDSGFDVFVSGRSIYFQPPSIGTSIPIFLRLADVKTLHISCTKALGDNPATRVQSWNSQEMAVYTNMPNPTAFDPNTSHPFLFTSANMTADQVDASAARLNSELTRLGTVLQFEMPWTADILPRSLILLSGTESELDTYYEVDSVEREFCATTGSIQRVRAVAVQNNS